MASEMYFIPQAALADANSKGSGSVAVALLLIVALIACVVLYWFLDL